MAKKRLKVDFDFDPNGPATELEAARLSEQKWYTLSYCTEEELRKKCEPDCALCEYSDRPWTKGRKPCILHKMGENCFDDNSLYCQWYNAWYNQHNFTEAQKIAKKLLAVISKGIKILEKEDALQHKNKDKR